MDTQHSNIRWQHCDEINAEFDPNRGTTDERDRGQARASHVRGPWLGWTRDFIVMITEGLKPEIELNNIRSSSCYLTDSRR
jgi:hypothetical protein